MGLLQIYTHVLLGWWMDPSHSALMHVKESSKKVIFSSVLCCMNQCFFATCSKSLKNVFPLVTEPHEIQGLKDKCSSSYDWSSNSFDL